MVPARSCFMVSFGDIGQSMMVAALAIEAGAALMAFWIFHSGVPGAGPAAFASCLVGGGACSHAASAKAMRATDRFMKSLLLKGIETGARSRGEHEGQTGEPQAAYVFRHASAQAPPTIIKTLNFRPVARLTSPGFWGEGRGSSP